MKAGGGRATAATPLENMGRSGTFRHPVFGHRNVWATQRAHPFLYPALVSEAAAVESAVTEALNRFLIANRL